MVSLVCAAGLTGSARSGHGTAVTAVCDGLMYSTVHAAVGMSVSAVSVLG